MPKNHTVERENPCFWFWKREKLGPQCENEECKCVRKKLEKFFLCAVENREIWQIFLFPFSFRFSLSSFEWRKNCRIFFLEVFSLTELTRISVLLWEIGSFFLFFDSIHSSEKGAFFPYFFKSLAKGHFQQMLLLLRSTKQAQTTKQIEKVISAHVNA